MYIQFKISTLYNKYHVHVVRDNDFFLQTQMFAQYVMYPTHLIH